MHSNTVQCKHKQKRRLSEEYTDFLATRLFIKCVRLLIYLLSVDIEKQAQCHVWDSANGPIMLFFVKYSAFVFRYRLHSIKKKEEKYTSQKNKFCSMCIDFKIVLDIYIYILYIFEHEYLDQRQCTTLFLDDINRVLVNCMFYL